VHNALMGQLFIFVLKYLTAIFLLVDDVLQIGLRCLQLIYTDLKICNSSNKTCQITTSYLQ
jgi:hypothetical protein